MSGGTSRARVRAAQQAAERFQRSTAGTGPTMAPIRMTFNDDDPASTRSFDRVFDGLGVTLAGMVSVLGDPSVLAAIRAAFADNFDKEAARSKWPALAASTIRERKRLGFGPGPILNRTGALRQHVLGAPATVTRTAGGAVLRIAPGPSVNGVRKYRILAMGGTTPTGGRIPARPMVVLKPGRSVKVTSAISRALRARARANGLR